MHAHGKSILDLPTIQNRNNLNLVHQFYRSLNISVNSLSTMGKLDSAEILVRETLDKLGPVKSDLIRNDTEWQNWDFEKLLDSLREYTVRNPVKNIDASNRNEKVTKNTGGLYRERNFKTYDKETKIISCVYCKSEQHYSSDCKKVKFIAERREFLKNNRLCFNCTGKNHSAANCRSRNCVRCNQRHHTSLCNLKNEESSLLGMLEDSRATIHPTLVAVVKGKRFRILLDTGAGSSFISSTLASHIGNKPLYWEQKIMETITTVVKQKLPLYSMQINSTDGKYTLDIKANKLDRPILTTLPNPNIKQLKQRYPHLAGLTFDIEDDNKGHPIHIILGAGDISCIKCTGLISGQSGEPIAENTIFGWTLMGHGNKPSTLNYFSNNSQDGYRKLYNLDVLGLQDCDEGDQQNVYEEFKEQLQRHADGSYSTKLPWKANHPRLHENMSGSLARMHTQIRKLKGNDDILKEYHQIIQDQLENEIIEAAPDTPTGESVLHAT